MLAFLLYSVALVIGLWISPERLLRLSFWVAVIDLDPRSDEAAERALPEVTEAYRLGPEQPERRPIVLDVIA